MKIKEILNNYSMLRLYIYIDQHILLLLYQSYPAFIILKLKKMDHIFMVDYHFKARH